MRLAVCYRTESTENYKRFCKEYPEIDITRDEWKSILYTYIDLFREYLLETGEKGKLPCGWGTFAIEKKKTKRTIDWNGKERVILPIDWKKSKEKGKRIYNFNYHTNGYHFKWRWFRETATFKQRGLWYFKASRPTSRLVAHYLKIDDSYQHKYLEWSKQ